jgi:ABC-type glycerol-3-phosphate transport system permease component
MPTHAPRDMSSEVPRARTRARRMPIPRLAGRSIGWILISLVFLVPYLWLAGASFKPREEIFRDISPISAHTFIPRDPTLQNFVTLLTQTGFRRALLNSGGVAVVSVVFSLAVNSMLAFSLARLRFRGRGALTILVLATLLVPFEVLVVPMYQILQRLGLNDSFAGLILPWICNPFLVFLLRQHFAELPGELMEAAAVDGCSYFRMYWNIMLPNIKPALISAAFIQFLWTWDAYLWPLVILRDPDKEVLTLAIARLFTDQDIGWELILSASFLSTLPVIILFVFLQKYYVEGVASYGIKG